MITFLSSVVTSLKNKQDKRIKDSLSLHGTRFYYMKNPKEKYKINLLLLWIIILPCQL